MYLDLDRGLSQWEPPPGSTPLRARPLSELSADEAFGGPPPRFPQGIGLEAQSLRGTGWLPIFEDADNKVLLYHTETGCVRAAPWVSLRTGGGCVFFANLVSQETRWLPPR